jgi:hypothetical protein
VNGFRPELDGVLENQEEEVTGVEIKAASTTAITHLQPE